MAPPTIAASIASMAAEAGKAMRRAWINVVAAAAIRPRWNSALYEVIVSPSIENNTGCTACLAQSIPCSDSIDNYSLPPDPIMLSAPSPGRAPGANAAGDGGCERRGG